MGQVNNRNSQFYPPAVTPPPLAVPVPTAPTSLRAVGTTSFSWTSEACAEVAARWAAGEASGDIARAMGITRSMVASKVRTLDLPLRKGGERKASARTKSVHRPGFGLEKTTVKMRKCLKCRHEFDPPNPLIFRCDNCIHLSKEYSPIAEGVSA